MSRDSQLGSTERIMRLLASSNAKKIISKGLYKEKELANKSLNFMLQQRKAQIERSKKRSESQNHRKRRKGVIDITKSQARRTKKYLENLSSGKVNIVSKKPESISNSIGRSFNGYPGDGMQSGQESSYGASKLISFSRIYLNNKMSQLYDKKTKDSIKTTGIEPFEDPFSRHLSPDQPNDSNFGPKSKIGLKVIRGGSRKLKTPGVIKMTSKHRFNRTSIKKGQRLRPFGRYSSIHSKKGMRSRKGSGSRMGSLEGSQLTNSDENDDNRQKFDSGNSDDFEPKNGNSAVEGSTPRRNNSIHLPKLARSDYKSVKQYLMNLKQNDIFKALSMNKRSSSVQPSTKNNPSTQNTDQEDVNPEKIEKVSKINSVSPNGFQSHSAMSMEAANPINTSPIHPLPLISPRKHQNPNSPKSKLKPGNGKSKQIKQPLEYLYLHDEETYTGYNICFKYFPTSQTITIKKPNKVLGLTRKDIKLKDIAQQFIHDWDELKLNKNFHFYLKNDILKKTSEENSIGLILKKITRQDFPVINMGHLSGLIGVKIITKKSFVGRRKGLLGAQHITHFLSMKPQSLKDAIGNVSLGSIDPGKVTLGPGLRSISVNMNGLIQSIVNEKGQKNSSLSPKAPIMAPRRSREGAVGGREFMPSGGFMNLAMMNKGIPSIRYQSSTSSSLKKDIKSIFDDFAKEKNQSNFKANRGPGMPSETIDHLTPSKNKKLEALKGENGVRSRSRWRRKSGATNASNMPEIGNPEDHISIRSESDNSILQERLKKVSTPVRTIRPRILQKKAKKKKKKTQKAEDNPDNQALYNASQLSTTYNENPTTAYQKVKHERRFLWLEKAIKEFQKQLNREKRSPNKHRYRLIKKRIADLIEITMILTRSVFDFKKEYYSILMSEYQRKKEAQSMMNSEIQKKIAGRFWRNPTISSNSQQLYEIMRTADGYDLQPQFNLFEVLTRFEEKNGNLNFLGFKSRLSAEIICQAVFPR